MLVLVVDMLGRVPRALKALLRKHGFNVSTSQDTCVPDAVLVYVRPTVSAVVRVVRELRANSQAPIIALGESESEYEVDLLLAAGVDHYVMPPHTLSDVMAHLRSLRRPAGTTTTALETARQSRASARDELDSP